MKNLIRIFVFSCFALFITSYWNRGFVLPSTALDFVKAGAALTVLFVIVRPLMKIVFLPLNIITLGLFSFVLYIFCLHVLSSWYGFFSIQTWQFYGFQAWIISIPRMHISYLSNLVLSSFSLSGIINVLDQMT